MAEHSVNNGRFKFDLNYRNFSGDEGLSIRVVGPVKDEQKELLRFDCFEKTPHFHVGVYDKNEITRITADNPVQFAMQRLTEDFVVLVSEAGGDQLTDQEQHAHQATLMELGQEAQVVVANAKDR